VRRLVAVADIAKNVQVSLKGFLSLDLLSSSPVLIPAISSLHGLICMLLTHHGTSDRRGNNMFKVQRAEFYTIGKRNE
jgi:hypothetical protein